MNVYLGGMPCEVVGKYRDKCAPFVTLEHGVNDSAVIGPQHAAVIMHFHTGGHLHDFVDHDGGCPSEKRIAPVHPDASNHIKPFLGLVDQPLDFLGRVLEIGVQRNDDISPCLCKSGHNRRVLAIIPVQKDPHDPSGILRCDPLDHIS